MSVRRSFRRLSKAAELALELNEAATRGDQHRAEQLFQVVLPQLPEKATRTYNTLLKAYANAGSAKKAVECYSQMHSSRVRTNARTYGKLVEAYAKRGDLESALVWVARMAKSFEVDQVVLNTLMDAAAQAGRVPEAEVLAEMQSQQVAPDVVAMSSMVHAFARNGKVADAAKWLQRAKELGLAPNIITYNSMIHACARIGDPKQAIRWFEQLQMAGLAPALASYGGVIEAFAKKGRPRAEAQKWFNRMARQHSPDAPAFVSLIWLCARGGQFWEAVEWVRRMQQTMPLDDRPYNALLAAAAQAGDPEGALQCLEKMKEKSLRVSVLTHTNIVNAYGKASQHLKAVAWLEVMANDHHAPNLLSYTSALEACLRVAAWDESLRLLDVMHQQGIRADRVLLGKLKRLMPLEVFQHWSSAQSFPTRT
ncbi:unnamed protein product [Effrenium voratum]|uniref:Pentatricopeptide repeat-containing protein-mitochondrial domain-containing protein n=1 Tax=Effrenium voratum TaxID=2562239 RepID=A0AA36HQF0_9DINO|nr:unnamed protein product [Effrenium voratum]